MVLLLGLPAPVVVDAWSGKRSFSAYAFQHGGVGLQTGVSGLTVQLYDLFQLTDGQVELTPQAVDHGGCIA
ncbi:hypothetical protein AB0J80_06140 [Actinoplanes sp. NPDC049548]|uniref:hypothetical protein n=1 Tax=Actinoplanes sp. NPDC049548 TaxID=3155152 RepID=UPI00344078D8